MKNPTTSIEQLKSIFYRLRIIKNRIENFKITDEEKTIMFNDAIKDVAKSITWIDNPIRMEFFVELVNIKLDSKDKKEENN